MLEGVVQPTPPNPSIVLTEADVYAEFAAVYAKVNLNF
jgi:hypothetical protein